VSVYAAVADSDCLHTQGAPRDVVDEVKPEDAWLKELEASQVRVQSSVWCGPMFLALTALRAHTACRRAALTRRRNPVVPTRLLALPCTRDRRCYQESQDLGRPRSDLVLDTMLDNTTSRSSLSSSSLQPTKTSRGFASAHNVLEDSTEPSTAASASSSGGAGASLKSVGSSSALAGAAVRTGPAAGEIAKDPTQVKNFFANLQNRTKPSKAKQAVTGAPPAAT
jgi:hypothetical protein